MNKNNNWIKNFIEEQKTKTENKVFLKESSLIDEFAVCSSNFKLIEKQVKNFDEIINKICNDIKVLSTEINDLINFYNQLDKKIQIQKGRITRQLREQNNEKKALETAFNGIYQRLGELENGN